MWEGALPVRHSRTHPIDFSPTMATSDPRAPQKGLPIVLTKRSIWSVPGSEKQLIAGTRSLPTLGAAT